MNFTVSERSSDRTGESPGGRISRSHGRPDFILIGAWRNVPTRQGITTVALADLA
jgi:hypothetical protein